MKHITYKQRLLLDSFGEHVEAVCKKRHWSMDWKARGAYLHLEASELIEAARGKKGSILDEASDVLFVLLSITQTHGIPFNLVAQNMLAKAERLMTSAPYPGEERED